MYELINVKTNENYEQMVSVRELNQALGIQKRFSAWWEDQAHRLNLLEGVDYTPYLQVHPQNLQQIQDFLITIDVAKHLAMISGGENAHKIRNYFIQVERNWNSPDKIIARALEMADKKLRQLENQMEIDKPKVLFAEAVEASVDSILIRDFAKLLAKNGVAIGEKRLFEWLRKFGYLQKYENKPTQKSVELGVLEMKEGVRFGSNNILKPYFTTKVTGKGQIYFMKKLVISPENNQISVNAFM